MNSDDLKLQELAEQIAKHLFTNGAGKHADRLVLEMPEGKDGGGWSEWAVTLAIKQYLVEHFQKVS